MHILIIEDEYHLADMIRDFLKARGDLAEICTDGEKGCRQALAEDYEAILLDVMLPGMDGFEILRKLRQEGKDTPVLMLTARSALEDKLKGFGEGAQDYLTKPFEMEELYARIHILSGKGMGGQQASRSEDLAAGNTRLDPGSRDLVCQSSGKRVLLPAKEYKLMELFLQNRGNVLSKEQITEHIWGYDSDAEYNHEEVYISFLRKKLKFIEADVSIETLRGMGYKLVEKES